MTVRRKITDLEFKALAAGDAIGGLYIGRGGRGVQPSPWGKSFQMGRDGDRKEVVYKYAEYLAASGLDKRARELRGSTLLCHCRPEEESHGDI